MRFKQHDLAPLRRDCASLAFRQKQGWCVQYELAAIASPATAASDATAVTASAHGDTTAYSLLTAECRTFVVHTHKSIRESWAWGVATTQ